MSLSGSCQCGNIQYSLDGEPLMTYACHCTDCQKRTGSAFSMGMIYPISAITVSGELTQWDRTSDEGNTNSRFSCSCCGNIIYGIGSNSPETIKLQPGTLDDTSKVQADAHIWARSAQPWVLFSSNALKYETQPENPLEIFEAVIKQRESGKG